MLTMPVALWREEVLNEGLCHYDWRSFCCAGCGAYLATHRRRIAPVEAAPVHSHDTRRRSLVGVGVELAPALT